MITAEFLHGVAEFVDSKVEKVVLNDSYEITNFELKQVENNMLQLKYIVPNGSVETVSHIDLRDNENNVISTNTVNIPITTDTLMLQTLDVKEGMDQ